MRCGLDAPRDAAVEHGTFATGCHIFVLARREGVELSVPYKYQVRCDVAIMFQQGVTYS
jgi:hypothetical protein